MTRMVDVVERRFAQAAGAREHVDLPSPREVWDSLSRREKVEVVAVLYDPERGMTQKEVGALFGVGHSTINQIRTDPDGRKQRAKRASYAGTCEDCGAPTSADSTRVKSRRCSACSAQAQHDARLWQDDAEIIEAIHAWVRVVGRRPGAGEWMRVNQVDPMAWPCTQLVAARFGSFGYAIAAAGFPHPRSVDRMEPGWRRCRKSFSGTVVWDLSRDAELAEAMRRT